MMYGFLEGEHDWMSGEAGDVLTTAADEFSEYIDIIGPHWRDRLEGLESPAPPPPDPKMTVDWKLMALAALTGALAWSMLARKK